MSDNQRNLERYLQKICDIQNNQQENLNNADLKQLAFEIGMTDQDWQHIQHTFDAHLTRGIGYYKYKNWDDAVEELEQAAAINPFHEQTLFTLASSFACRYHEHERSVDKSMAKYYAKQCLEIYPANEQALQLISALRKEDVQRRLTERESLRTLLVAASLGAIVFAGLAYLSWTTSNTLSNRTSPNTAKEIRVVKHDNGLRTVGEVMPGIVMDESEVPVRFLNDEDATGLSFEVRSSEFRDFGDEYSYSLKGVVRVTDVDTEINNLKMRVELVDDENKVRVSKVIDLIDDQYGQPIMGGDAQELHFRKFIQTPSMPDFKEVRVSVQQITSKKKE
ncbi:hypothetical protein V6R21_17940 [Limibacter armeniacum]|uniref:hypothetical protein n=1 Tax=Limibacter armeniacum TaxID=466084 RepID=UPI002FE64324